MSNHRPEHIREKLVKRYKVTLKPNVCRYDIDVGRCGALDCSINHYELHVTNFLSGIPPLQATNDTEIAGDRCDRLELFGLRGKATCGYIAWYDSEGRVVNSWYKTK